MDLATPTNIQKFPALRACLCRRRVGKWPSSARASVPDRKNRRMAQPPRESPEDPWAGFATATLARLARTPEVRLRDTRQSESVCACCGKSSTTRRQSAGGCAGRLPLATQ